MARKLSFIVLASILGAVFISRLGEEPTALAQGARPFSSSAEYVFLTTWGSFGSEAGEFLFPSGVAVGPDGNVYVADTLNSRIQVFTAAGVFLRQVGTTGGGTGEGELNQPAAVAQDAAGDIYVADTQNHRIQVFTANGVYRWLWGGWGVGEGQFKEPYGLAIGNGNADRSDPQVYVADKNNSRIQVFSRMGTFLGSWGGRGDGEGYFNWPSGVLIGSDDNIYVADTYNHLIQVLTPEGSFVRQWGERGSGDRQFDHPSGLAAGPDGQIFVVDQDNSRIQFFSPSGSFLGKWGSAGSDPGQFDWPSTTAVGADGKVYVADTRNHRIQVFQRQERHATFLPLLLRVRPASFPAGR